MSRSVGQQGVSRNRPVGLRWNTMVHAGGGYWIFVAVAALLAGRGLAAHEAARLSPPDGAERPRGEARLSTAEGIRIRGEDLPGDISLSVRIEGSGGSMTEAFATRTDSSGSFDVRARGGSLPLGLSSPLDFAGRQVAVADAGGVVLLSGKFPNAADEVELGRGSSALVPAQGSPFPGASGRIRVKAGTGRHAIEVRARGLADESAYTVCVIGSDGLQQETIGTITTQGGGNGALKIDSEDGGMLPLGAGGIAELVGLELRIKDADGSVILTGTIPALGREVEDDVEIEVQFDLARPGASPEPRIKGDVNLRSEPGNDRVRVRLDEATPGASYSATIHRPVASGEPVREPIASLAADEDGKAESTALGTQVLPLGAATVADLAGAVVEVADSEGRLVLSGTVPAVQAPPVEPRPEVEELRFVVGLSRPVPAPLPRVNGKVEFEEESDEHEIEVEIQDLPAGAAVRVELRDPAGAAEILVEGEADGFGDLRRKQDILGAERLPFDAASFREYDGFSIVVLDAGGQTILSGAVMVPAASPPAAGGGAVELIRFDMVGEYDAAFLRGDADRSFTIEITDAIRILEVLFLRTPFPACRDALDANDDSNLDISDPVVILIHLFLDRPQLPFPGVAIPGFDPTVDRLFCKDN